VLRDLIEPWGYFVETPLISAVNSLPYLVVREREVQVSKKQLKTGERRKADAQAQATIIRVVGREMIKEHGEFRSLGGVFLVVFFSFFSFGFGGLFLLSFVWCFF